MGAIERQIIHQNWITLLLLVALFLLAILKYNKPKYLFGYFVAFFSEGIIKKNVEKDNLILSGFNGVFFVFSNLVISLCLGLIKYGNSLSFLEFIIIFFLTLFYFITLYFIDFVLIKLIGESEKIKHLRYGKLGYLFALSLWLFPIVIFYQFGVKNLYILVLSFIFLILVRVGLLTLNNKTLIYKNLFYFILYLCTLQIAPLLILYKLTRV